MAAEYNEQVDVSGQKTLWHWDGQKAEVVVVTRKNGGEVDFVTIVGKNVGRVGVLSTCGIYIYISMPYITEQAWQ